MGVVMVMIFQECYQFGHRSSTSNGSVSATFGTSKFFGLLHGKDLEVGANDLRVNYFAEIVGFLMK